MRDLHILIDVVAELVDTAAHLIVVEAVRTDTVVCRVVLDRIEYLTVGDTPRHHDIGGGMGLREHVLDLLAGIDVPLRNTVIEHVLAPLVLQALVLSGELHDGEGLTRVHALMHEVDHDIISTADRLLQGGCAVLDEVLRVVEVDVRTVAEARDTYEVREVLRLRILNHLHREGGTELRDPETAELDAVDVFRSDVQCFRRSKEAHHLFIIERDVIDRIDSRQVLETPDHGRVIVSEDVELQQVMVDLMVIEVGGDDRAGNIIGRMLYRGEGVDLLAMRQHDDTARVLARGPAYADAALYETVDLRTSLIDALLLVILLHHTEGRLVREGTDGTRLEGVAVAEDDTGVGMGLRLVFTGEVQVDIRLLITVEAEEGLERNIEAHTVQLRAALRALLRRHVAARHTGVLLHLR